MMGVARGRNKSMDPARNARDELLRDAVEGLSRGRKALSPKHLYDDRGSKLFDDICGLDEYYPTRTEMAIMRANIAEMVAAIGPQCVLIEFGSGSSTKTQLLLDHLETPAAYVPIDIAGEHLERAAQRIRKRNPHLEVIPVCTDFTRPVDLPLNGLDGARRVVYFPGSTIGNFGPSDARDLLARMASICRRSGAVLLGADLKKDVETLETAYNDSQGITAEFNLNLLRRLNRELDADFQLDQFEHNATYNEHEGRIEMHLVSQGPQSVRVDGSTIKFAKGETILTECSYKYSPSEFARLARSAGLDVQKVWVDDRSLFSVQYLVPA